MLARRAREPIFGYVVSQNDQVVTILAMHVFAAATNTPIDRRHEPKLYLRLRDPSSWDHSGTSLGTPLPDQLQRAAVCARSLFRVRPDDLQELHLAASDPAGTPKRGGHGDSTHVRLSPCPSPATVVAVSPYHLRCGDPFEHLLSGSRCLAAPLFRDPEGATNVCPRITSIETIVE